MLIFVLSAEMHGIVAIRAILNGVEAPLQFNVDPLAIMEQVVRDRDYTEDRPIIIAATHFEVNDHVALSIFAMAVKRMDPRAWVFAYSMMALSSEDRGEHLDGVIPKGVEGVDKLIEFLQADPQKAKTLAELKAQFPWLK